MKGDDMDLNLRYRVNRPAVIGEVLDNEAIIVNLDSGAYYSLHDSGSLIWTWIEQEHSLAEIIEGVSNLHVGERATFGQEISRLLSELEAENLIAPADGSLSLGAVPLVTPLEHKSAFLPPQLEKFTDMADVLLLDPIHEVDETGWPHPAPEQPARAQR
jgi:hypothetical protein